jgi:hypothetical protein
MTSWVPVALWEINRRSNSHHTALFTTQPDSEKSGGAATQRRFYRIENQHASHFTMTTMRLRRGCRMGFCRPWREGATGLPQRIASTTTNNSDKATYRQVSHEAKSGGCSSAIWEYLILVRDIPGDEAALECAV